MQWETRDFFEQLGLGKRPGTSQSDYLYFIDFSKNSESGTLLSSPETSPEISTASLPFESCARTNKLELTDSSPAISRLQHGVKVHISWVTCFVSLSFRIDEQQKLIALRRLKASPAMKLPRPDTTQFYSTPPPPYTVHSLSLFLSLSLSV